MASSSVPRNPGRGGDLGSELTSVQFAAIARRLSEAARMSGVEPPAFRSPPRVAGLRRSIRRERDGSATVAVALRGRPGLAVIADMIDGVCAAAELPGVEGAVLRDELWIAVAALVEEQDEAGSEPLPARRAA
jgi:hypothetical protein